MIYVDITGDLIAGLVLSQIIYWHMPKSNGESRLKVIHDNKYWLARQYSDWYNEVRITKDQANRAIQILVDKGLVEKKVYKFNGMATVHLRLNKVALMLLINKAQIEYEEAKKKKEEEDRQKRSVSETIPVLDEANSGLGSDQDPNGLRPRPLTESTTENTTKIKNQDLVHQAAHAHDSNQLSLFSDEDFEAELRRRTGDHSLSISKVSDSERSDLPAAVGGKVDKSGNNILPRGGHAPDAFAAFWSQHPIKKGKLAAQTAWNRLKANSELVDIIMHDMANRKQNDRQWVEGFAPHPATYLNGARWTDEIEPLTNKKTGVQSKQDQKLSDEEKQNQARRNAVARMRGEMQ